MLSFDLEAGDKTSADDLSLAFSLSLELDRVTEFETRGSRLLFGATLGKASRPRCSHHQGLPQAPMIS
jgi:hypothetical protein